MIEFSHFQFRTAYYLNGKINQIIPFCSPAIFRQSHDDNISKCCAPFRNFNEMSVLWVTSLRLPKCLRINLVLYDCTAKQSIHYIRRKNWKKKRITRGAHKLQIFYLENLNANPMNILVHLQLLWLHNDPQFKVLLHLLPFGRNLKGECWDPNLGN